MEKKLEQIKGHLIVSCQALPHEPLHSSFIMGRMARAAAEGGAIGIRANTREDIEEIKKIRGHLFLHGQGFRRPALSPVPAPVPALFLLPPVKNQPF